MEYLNTSQSKSYKRYCKTLELKNDVDLINEYIKIHADGGVWKEVKEEMKGVGICDMEIYISGARLFMIMDTIPDFDHEEAMSRLSKKPRQAEWEAFVSRFQKTSSSTTADEKWQLMERIFKLCD